MEDHEERAVTNSPKTNAARKQQQHKNSGMFPGINPAHHLRAKTRIIKTKPRNN